MKRVVPCVGQRWTTARGPFIIEYITTDGWAFGVADDRSHVDVGVLWLETHGRLIGSTYTRFRRDGWPYCPRCDEDELYSLATPATVETICGCYRCGPWPMTVLTDGGVSMPNKNEKGGS